MSVAERPLGVFDSGVGGLSVVREMRRALPGESIVYVADSAYCPYGDRPAEVVRGRALALAAHLGTLESKLLVVACNTATGAALEAVRAAVAAPVVGLEPAVKTAAARTRRRRIGVLATAGTLASERFARLVRDHASAVTVVPQACPGLVELIEEGELDGPRLQARLGELTLPLREAAVDAVVLGCTHYPFVREALARVLGPEVELIDSAPAIVRRVRWLLEQSGLLRPDGGQGTLRVLTTGDPEPLARVIARLWGAPLPVERLEL